MHYGSRTTVGFAEQRIDAVEKSTGNVKYLGDKSFQGMLHAKVATSTEAHARIKSIDTSEAWKVQGVRAIVTGKTFPFPIGPILADRPPIAFDKVRYYGEPIAVIVADHPYQAKQAAGKIVAEYEPLPIVNSVEQAFQKDAPLIHEQSGQYTKLIDNVYPVPGTNIASHVKIRKGEFGKAWAVCKDTISATYSFNLSDHAAMETRTATVEINSDGRVIVHSTSQSPFTIKKIFNQFFNLDVGKVIVHIPMLGGAFGGKGAVQLEPLAYLASNAVGGKLVKLQFEREEDMMTAPCHIGFNATVKLGVNEEGKLIAGQYTFLIEAGAYSDQAAGITRAAALDCTGPYHIPNVWCDSYCMYTNHPYATSFRGYGHPELTFAIERTIDQFADKLQMDPIEFRLLNVIKPGQTTPTQSILTPNNIGDAAKCMTRAKELIGWDGKQPIVSENGLVRAKGVALFWKTSTTSTNAQAGAILKFEADGTVTLTSAAVELGQGTKTILAQIAAERLKMNVSDIHVTMEVNTQYTPHQWRTVASSTTFLAGNAVLAAADDAIRQLKRIGAVALQCSEEDLDVGNGRVYIKAKPDIGINIETVALGYKYPNGHTVGGQVIGIGVHVQRHLTPMDKETGFGDPGPWWSVGAQAVEIEWDESNYHYKIVKAVTVLDGGTIINPMTAAQQMRGGIFLGLSIARGESFEFNEQGVIQNPDLRTYQLMRFGEQPDEYIVEFVETPAEDGPFGARGIGEYGVIGAAAALANGLSLATNVELTQLPLTPELIWRTRRAAYDPV
ncbi:xanthine dehydrogenase family protein molybdopterin-binding subunit [Sporosarcina luteola]|uniref:xanthine dehydrogenase family protein molybdopterin-binding subunit n=1 Tax=Sporosarcina luteola TaxID=582850 RepID=UPI002559F438|nr:xanthine dehydrogenase family protein molybdopterin-binding subunit [Sporosarcina luteola]